MKNYNTYKDQIQGFSEVSEAVKTEEKIAASRIAGLRLEMAHLDEYQTHVKETIDRLSLFVEKKPQTKTRAVKSALVILMSDKGLTGGLWRRMIDEFLKTDRQAYQIVVTVGTKGEKYLKEEKRDVEKTFENPADAFAYVSDSFQRRILSEVDILYPKFVSLIEQKPVVVPFLPFVFGRDARKVVSGFPIIDPQRSGPAMFDVLMKKYQASYFQKIALEGKLSEFAARTISMEHADTKTRELIKGLGLTYRKERRRVLTQKQLESFIAHKII